jgi:hypothetical protein
MCYSIFLCIQANAVSSHPWVRCSHDPLMLRPLAHLCSRCRVMRFSRTSNLYRHMRGCKGPYDSTPIPGRRRRSSPAPSISSPVPDSEQSLPSGTSPESSTVDASSPQVFPPELNDGLDPNPSWGPVPLASWQRQRFSFISDVEQNPTPMPIAQRVYLPTSLPPPLPPPVMSTNVLLVSPANFYESYDLESFIMSSPPSFNTHDARADSTLPQQSRFSSFVQAEVGAVVASNAPTATNM